MFTVREADRERSESSPLMFTVRKADRERSESYLAPTLTISPPTSHSPPSRRSCASPCSASM